LTRLSLTQLADHRQTGSSNVSEFADRMQVWWIATFGTESRALSAEAYLPPMREWLISFWPRIS